MIELCMKEIAKEISREAGIDLNVSQAVVTKLLEKLSYEVFSGNASGAMQLLEKFDPARGK